MLEDRISRLQGRIAFLESNTAGPVLLRDPYAPTACQLSRQAIPNITERRTLSPVMTQALYASFNFHCTMPTDL